MKLKKGEFNEKLVAGWSLGQVLGYDGCYDSGTCPHGYPLEISQIIFGNLLA